MGGGGEKIERWREREESEERERREEKERRQREREERESVSFSKKIKIAAVLPQSPHHLEGKAERRYVSGLPCQVVSGVGEHPGG